MPRYIRCWCGCELAVSPRTTLARIKCPVCGQQLDVSQFPETDAEDGPTLYRTTPATPESIETASEKTEAPVGILHDRGQVVTVWLLAAWMSTLALVGILPAGWDVGDHLQALDSPGVARWAYALMLLGVVQLAYAVYLILAPDWTSLWVVSIVWLVVAALYALMVAVTLFGNEQTGLIRLLQMEAHAVRAAGQMFSPATMWCFMMLSLTGLTAYLAGKVSARWHDREQMRYDAAGSPASTAREPT